MTSGSLELGSLACFLRTWVHENSEEILLLQNCIPGFKICVNAQRWFNFQCIQFNFKRYTDIAILTHLLGWRDWWWECEAHLTLSHFLCPDKWHLQAVAGIAYLTLSLLWQVHGTAPTAKKLIDVSGRREPTTHLPNTLLFYPQVTRYCTPLLPAPGQTTPITPSWWASWGAMGTLKKKLYRLPWGTTSLKSTTDIQHCCASDMHFGWKTTSDQRFPFFSLECIRCSMGKGQMCKVSPACSQTGAVKLALLLAVY